MTGDNLRTSPDQLSFVRIYRTCPQFSGSVPSFLGFSSDTGPEAGESVYMGPVPIFRGFFQCLIGDRPTVGLPRIWGQIGYHDDSTGKGPESANILPMISLILDLSPMPEPQCPRLPCPWRTLCVRGTA